MSSWMPWARSHRRTLTVSSALWVSTQAGMLVVSVRKVILHPFSDVDDSGRLDFSEFVNVCATYCMYSQDDILDCTYAVR